MRMANLALMLLLALTCRFALGQPTTDSTADRNQILGSIAEISRAYVARDPAPFERLYLEGHTSIVRVKPTYNLREQLIAMMQADSVLLRAGKKLEYRTISYESDPPQINLYDRAAVVTVAKTNSWQYEIRRCQTRTQSTELWVKPANEWKVAAVHTTTFPCNSRQFYPPHAAVAAIESKLKPPANTDVEGEQQLRELIRTLVAARASLEEPFAAVVERHIADNFVSTDLKGEVSGDRSLLNMIQVPLPSRSIGFRNQEDAVVVYGNAAVYTYRLRDKPEASDGLQRCTIIFVRLDGKWMIAAAHTSRPSDDRSSGSVPATVATADKANLK